jgi:hypothetical protein
MNKVDNVISKYLEATGLWCEAPVLTPDEEEAAQVTTSKVQRGEQLTAGGEKLVKAKQKKDKEQSQTASRVASKVDQS